MIGLKISSDVHVLNGRVIPFLERDGCIAAQFKYMNEQSESVVLSLSIMSNMDRFFRMLRTYGGYKLHTEIVSEWVKDGNSFIKAYYIKEVSFIRDISDKDIIEEEIEKEILIDV